MLKMIFEITKDIYKSNVKSPIFKTLRIILTAMIAYVLLSIAIPIISHRSVFYSVIVCGGLALIEVCIPYIILVLITEAVETKLWKKEGEMSIIREIESVNKGNENQRQSLIFNEVVDENSKLMNRLPFSSSPVYPLELMKKADEHFAFIDSQYSDMCDYMYQRVQESFIPRDTPFVASIVEGQYEYIDDIFDMIDTSLSEEPKTRHNIAGFLQAINLHTVFKEIIEYCTEHNISPIYDPSYLKNLRKLLEDYYADYGILQKGAKGEKNVSEHLSLYRDRLINLENIRFEVEKTSVEADNIVICEKGVFCIETKNYGNENETIVISKDGKWRRFNDEYEKHMPNVTEQHNRHIGIMQRLVNKELEEKGIDVPYIDFQPIYVIANDEVSIENESNELVVLRSSMVYPYIAKQKSEFKLSKEVQMEIKDIILTYNQGAKKYPIKDYREAFKYNFDGLVTTVERRVMYYKLYDDSVQTLQSRGKLVSERRIDGKQYIELN
ncbi:MAG: nuclease-related domain-containing protein [Bacillota bacterium]|nr:nuclease-related domain-containing protein [Bacillota bacterium]